MRAPSRDELGHWWRVANSFSPRDKAFWLGLLHDTVEDGYLPKPILRIWPALDAITKRPGESYWNEYLERVQSSSLAKRVKLADAMDNYNRPQRRKKYLRVIELLNDREEAS